MNNTFDTKSKDWTDGEIALAVLALQKIGFTSQQFGGKIPTDVFFALCENTNTTSIELAIVRDHPKHGLQILMRARGAADRHFPGGAWHMPGTVLQPFEDAEIGLARLFRAEVVIDPAQIGRKPEFVTSQDIAMGRGPGQCLRGPEVNRIFLLKLTEAEAEKIKLDDVKKFFNINGGIPINTLEHHKTMIGYLRKHLGM